MTTKKTYFDKLLKQEGLDEPPEEEPKQEEKDYPGGKIPVNRSGGVKTPVGASDLKERMNGAKKKRYLIAGQPMEFYTIGDIAKALGRRPVTIRSWESKGLIPHANYRTPAPQNEQLPGVASVGRRLYTVTQAEFLLEAVELFKLNSKTEADWSGFQHHAVTNWPI